MDEIAERIFALLKEKGIEQKELAVMLGTTDKTISAWKTGRSQAFTKKLPQIAAILGTTVSHLLGEENEKLTSQQGSELSEALVKCLCRLTPEEQKLIDSYAKRLIAARADIDFGEINPSDIVISGTDPQLP